MDVRVRELLPSTNTVLSCYDDYIDNGLDIRKIPLYSDYPSPACAAIPSIAKRPHMKKFLSLLCLFTSFYAAAQVRQLHFDKLTVENGLPENFVTCSIQDSSGYIWFGTQNGLVRYDGYNVKVYRLGTEDKNVAAYRSVRCLVE